MSIGFRLETERLYLRPWTMSDADCAFFHYLNSDDEVMRFFPFRRNREESDAVLKKLIEAFTHEDMGWMATCLKDTGEVTGFTGLSPVRFEAAFTPAIEIGWRLGTAYWGKGYASEAARGLLAHAFGKLELDGIVSFAAQGNHASMAVMTRIGMGPDPVFDFDMPGIGDDFAHLRRHIFYRITRQDWLESKGRPQGRPR